MRPCIAGLLMQHPISIGNVIGIQKTILILQCVPFGEHGSNELCVDGTINDGVRHMHTHGAQLSRHALRQRSKRHLAARESSEMGAATQRGGSAGKNDGALMRCAYRTFCIWSLNHSFGYFAPHQKASQGTHLPHLGVAPSGFGQDAHRGISTNIEDYHFNRT